MGTSDETMSFEGSDPGAGWKRLRVARRVWISILAASAGISAFATTATAGSLGDGFWFSQCAHIIDGGLTAGACSQSQLKKAVAEGRMAQPGQFSIQTGGHHTGTAPGVVQVIGGPARPGTVFTLTGKPAADEIVVFNCMSNGHEYAVIVGGIRLGRHALARLTLVNGLPSVRLTRMTATRRVTRAY
jgi:hypothetical protein